MKHIFNIKNLLLTLVLGAGALVTSCDDDDKLAPADALFRPIVGETTVAGTWIELSWDRYEGADYYDLLLTGKDGLELTAETDTTFYRFEGLNYDTDYVIKLRSHSKASGLESKYYVVSTLTTTDFPTKLKGVQAIDNMALVSWGDDVYTNLKLYHVVTPEGSTEKEAKLVEDRVLTDADLKSGKVLFENLESEQDYIVRAYRDGEYLGKKVFSTTAPETFEGAVSDLRDVSEEDSYGYLTQAFYDDLVATYPDQDITIVLEAGRKYEMISVKLPATTGTIKLVTGLSLKGKAILEVKGNFDLAGSIGGFIAEKINFTDHPTLKNNTGTTYLFNIGTSDTQIGTMKFIDCDIKYKRGVCRIKTAAVIENLSIDNCIVDSIGGYGILNAANNGANIKNIKLINSSFSHCEKMFVTDKDNKDGNTFSAENCTFVFNLKSGNNYMFDFNKTTFASDPQLKNCIFGPGSITGKVGKYSAFRAAKGNMQLDNCYGTNDIEWFMAEGAEKPTSAFEDLNSTGADVKGTFEDAINSNFTLLINDLKGVAGDPRWW